MYSVLEKCKENGDLCEIYTDFAGSDKFDVGFVTDYDDNFALFEAVSPDGRHDGFICMAIDNISELCTDTAYLEAVKKLMPYYHFTRKNLSVDGGKVLDGVLAYVCAENKVCSVCTFADKTVCGTVKGVDSDVVELDMLDNYGKADGKSYFRAEDIVALSFGSNTEIKLEILKNTR